MFPNNLYLTDNTFDVNNKTSEIVGTKGRLYEVDTDSGQIKVKAILSNSVSAVLVCQNQSDLFALNRDINTVTYIHSGNVYAEFPTGQTPYGICEDNNGNIYISNYGDSTLTFIQNTGNGTYLVDKTPIVVGKGPRGIVSDINGVIWVACYLENIVCKVVNKVVVDKIRISQNPEGITCDKNGNIWVTCSTSNTVNLIIKGKKSFSVATGRTPVAVVTDSNGTAYTANFQDDSITVINLPNDGTTNIYSQTIPVGDGPTGLAVDSRDFIYVNSNLSGGDVKKINSKTLAVIDSIKVGSNPYAFGDFTGCSAYNVFNPKSTRVTQASGIVENAAEFLDAIRPTFTIEDLVEKANETEITIGSDLIDLDKFAGITLNDVQHQPDNKFKFILGHSEIGTKLVLKGNYSVNNKAKSMVFTPISYSNVFQIKFGMVDSKYENYHELATTVVDFNKHEICTLTVSTLDYKGHLVILIPNRIFSNVKDFTTMGSGYNYANAWASQNNDDTGKANLEKIKSQLSNNDLNVYNVLFYNKTSEEHELNFFHFYRSNMKYI